MSQSRGVLPTTMFVNYIYNGSGPLPEKVEHLWIRHCMWSSLGN